MPEPIAHALDAPLDRPLAAAATQAFEELGYFFVESLGDDAAPIVEHAAAAVDFAGPLYGTLVLSVADGVLPALAANMLGADEPPDEPMQLDALGEIANVICGSVLPVLGGPRAVFALGAPRAGASRLAVERAGGSLVGVARLDLDGARADVHWFVR